MGIYEFRPQDAEDFARHVGIAAKRRGRELIFLKCPYCGYHSRDKNKFFINLETGQFLCFRASCGAKGNMLTLAKDFNFSLGYDADVYYRNVKQYKKFTAAPKPEPKAPALRFLEKRGISSETAKKYNLTVQSDHENVLVFPFYDEKEELSFIKYRKMDFDKSRDSCKEWCEADCKPILFGMNHVNYENKTLVLTEGQMDSLALSEAGVENVVSVPTGARGFTWVPHCWDFLKKFEKLIVFGDYENEKVTLLDEMHQRFDGAVYYVKPEDYRGCKDANEILLKHGKDALISAVRGAIQVEHPKIKNLADVEQVDLSQLERFSTGIRSVDRVLGGFFFGQLILLTGERGEGKSTLASQFGSFALAAGYSLFLYSGELMNWFVKSWFDSQVAGAEHINKKVSGSGYESYSVDGQVVPLIEQWYRDKAYIYDNSLFAGEDEGNCLLKTLETAIKQYGCRVLILDNLMTALIDDTSIDQFRQQTIFVNQLARLAKQYNVIIFLIAHPRKKIGFNFDNDDVAGSSNITNLVDVVMRYAKPSGDDVSLDTTDRELTIYKNRLTGQTCRKGIKLYFEPSSKRISEDPNGFDWKLGWESLDQNNGFMKVKDGVEVPFS